MRLVPVFFRLLKMISKNSSFPPQELNFPFPNVLVTSKYQMVLAQHEGGGGGEVG